MMSKEPIVIWGCGKIAKQFCREHRDSIQIEFFLSNNKKETVFEMEDGTAYKVYRPDEQQFLKKRIVICCAAYEDVAEQLMLLGYEPFRDFMDYELASAVLSEKKLVLFYGFCHLRGIKDYLHYSDAFCSQYRGFFCPNYLAQSAYEQHRLRYLAKHCSVLLYGIAVTPENHRKNEAVLRLIAEGTKKLCVQGVYFGAYFPQKKRLFNAMNPYAVKSERYDYTPFSYGDSWLNECIDRGMTADDVMEALSVGKIFELDFVKSYLEDEWKRIRFLEAQSDIKIAEYIQKHFQERRLFRNEAHMENEILKQYAVQVLEALGLFADLPEIEEALMRCSQHLIYPEVARELGLEWDVEKEMLELYTYDGWKQMTVREYVEQYMMYCRQIKGLKEQSLLP